MPVCCEIFNLKDKLDLFFLLKAETHSFPAAFVLHQSDQNQQCSRGANLKKNLEDVKDLLALPGINTIVGSVMPSIKQHFIEDDLNLKISLRQVVLNSGVFIRIS